MKRQRMTCMMVSLAFMATAGCCKDKEEEPSEPTKPAIAPAPNAEATVTAQPTATAKRTYHDAGKILSPDGGGAFGGPPPVVTGKRTATPPTTQPPPDTTTFGGPPPIATRKNTGSPPTARPPATSTAFGKPPGLR